MITTTHAILNTAILGRKGHPERNWPALLGAALPDLPMFTYFSVVFLMQGFLSSSRIRHFDEFHLRVTWVDWAHSIPLALAAALLCLLFKYKPGVIFSLSLGLHDLEDLPFHSDYPHAHFLPFSHWRFTSPISSWDPHHYGNLVGSLEWLAVLACVVVLWRRGLSFRVQLALIFICVFHGFWIVYAYWGLRW
jgi:hypothetical protein